MHKVIIPYFLALSITPITHSLEGTLLVNHTLVSQYISGSSLEFPCKDPITCKPNLKELKLLYVK